MKKSTVVAAVQLATKTYNAYSRERYGAQWVKCAALLLKSGFTPAEAEQQLRSKNMRWAANMAKIQTKSGYFASFAAMLEKDAPHMLRQAKEWAVKS